MNKRMSLEEAVRLIPDGSSVAFGGWTVCRAPMAAVRELVRQKKQDLAIVGSMSGPTTDLLIGAGCVKYAEIFYHGLEKFGSAYNSQRKVGMPVGKKEVFIDDITVGDYVAKVIAGAMGIPFIPSYSHKGSDFLNMEYDMLRDRRGSDRRFPKKKYELMKDPFWGMEDVVLIPSANPDYAFIHVQEVSESGVVRINGMVGADYYLAAAGKTTIVTAEKIVSDEEISRQPEKNTIPGVFVDIICEVPYGAYETQLMDYYDYDNEYYAEYVAMSKADHFDKWLEKWVYGTKNQQDFLEKVGRARLDRIYVDSDVGYQKGKKMK
ncbi:MAG: CoA transferase subunit A [Lachnospiraceae bacterium]|nr:CoA transferase subunit A [Lachnospiraceae bacterium]